MQLSIRNQLEATITSVTRGEAMGTVHTRLSGGQEVVAAITLDGIEELKLAEGQPTIVLIKATEMAVAKGEVDNLSVRNKLPGTIRSISAGTVMTNLRIEIARDVTLTAVITNEAIDDLNLAHGDAVTALIKATDVSLATA